MIPEPLTRRVLLGGGVSTLGLWLAGCATLPTRTPTRIQTTAAQVPADVALLYGAVDDGGYHVRASRMDIVPQRFWRQDVTDPTGEAVGTVVVDTANRFLYHVGFDGRATRYGVGIGAAGFEWSGRAHIAYKREWPRWTPPADTIVRHPELEKYRSGMEPGPDNPLGHGRFIHHGNVDTLYRIHGNEDERTIGQAVSSGCVCMLPQDIIHLHANVRTGSPLLVTALAA